LSQLTKMLSKITIEATQNAELDDNLGYDKNEVSGSDNRRNGFTSKTILIEDCLFLASTCRPKMASLLITSKSICCSTKYCSRGTCRSAEIPHAAWVLALGIFHRSWRHNSRVAFEKAGMQVFGQAVKFWQKRVFEYDLMVKITGGFKTRLRGLLAGYQRLSRYQLWRVALMCVWRCHERSLHSRWENNYKKLRFL